MELTSLPVRQPRLELVGVENVEDSLSRDFGAHRDGRGVGIELEVRHCVGVRGQDDFTALFDGKAREICVEILAPRKAVDLDRDTEIGAGCKYIFPSRLEPRAMMEVPAPRVGKNMHLGGVDCAQ